MPEQTAAAITPRAGCASGDQASIDADGNVRITGRIKDLIIRGGENVAPKEIEDVLRQHPAVADVSVYAVTSEFFGEEVAAAIRPQAGATIDAAESLRNSAKSGWPGSRCRASSSSVDDVPDDRVRKDSEVQAARAARSRAPRRRARSAYCFSIFDGVSHFRPSFSLMVPVTVALILERARLAGLLRDLVLGDVVLGLGALRVGDEQHVLALVGIGLLELALGAHQRALERFVGERREPRSRHRQGQHRGGQDKHTPLHLGSS